jgi:hypothetical protein
MHGIRSLRGSLWIAAGGCCWRASRHAWPQCQASLEGAQTNGSVNGAAARTGTVPRCAWAQQASRLWPLRHVLRHVLGLGRAGAGASRPGTVTCTRMTSRRWVPRQTARASARSPNLPRPMTRRVARTPVAAALGEGPATGEGVTVGKRPAARPAGATLSGAMARAWPRQPGPSSLARALVRRGRRQGRELRVWPRAAACPARRWSRALMMARAWPRQRPVARARVGEGRGGRGGGYSGQGRPLVLLALARRLAIPRGAFAHSSCKRMELPCP